LATATGYPLANAVTASTTAASTTCSLGNGAQHVVQITFDNVHFFRDNPNVPSDLEQMPHLLNFIENNGTMLSNNHTPLIAHTANDSLTNYTGLYGDRHGMGISNSYPYFTPSSTANLAGSFVYWTNPIIDDATATPSTTDHNPSMIYSARVPAKAVTSTATGVAAATPAPWVPFTRAGCNVGDTSTANMVLENTGDIPQVFGPTSPEATQLAADVTDTFKDKETNDYIGVSIHCGTGAAAATCANAQAVKYGQTSPSPTAVADRLPDEPGGYNGFQAVHGHRYVAPVVGAGTPNLVRNGYQITNAAGNLVDLTGREIDGQFLHTPGFPGFGPISAPQTLAYMADMQESGVQVTYGYIADLHANNNRRIVGSPCLTAKSGALGPADPCYEANAAYYDAAFQTFFNRLAADGITPANTLFVFTADEGDHFPGANVGRAITPACTGTPGTTSYTCSYPAGTLGELNTNLTGLLATETGQHHTLRPRERLGAPVLRERPAGGHRPNHPPTRARRGEPEGQQSLHVGRVQRLGDRPAGRQLPRRPGGGADPALRGCRPQPHPDVLALRQTGPLPERRVHHLPGNPTLRPDRDRQPLRDDQPELRLEPR
jgi:hypothetical protein